MVKGICPRSASENGIPHTKVDATGPVSASKSSVPPMPSFANANGEPLLVRRRVGDGAAYAVGSFLGRAYLRSRNEGLEQLIGHVQETVARVHGVRLVTEVRIVGEAA